jgi:hypothetical protein
MKTFLSGLFAVVFLASSLSAQAEKVALIKVTGTINPVTSRAASMRRSLEAIGFHVSPVREAPPWRAFRFRFPWLLTTITT